jgi:hypothetical protein
MRNLALNRSLAPAAPVNCACELVSPTGDGADQVWVTQGDAQRPDLRAQIAFFDDPARPNAADQHVLVDERSVRLDQHHQHVEGAPAEFYRPAISEHFAAMRQDPETAELDARRRFGHRIHGRAIVEQIFVGFTVFGCVDTEAISGAPRGEQRLKSPTAAPVIVGEVLREKEPMLRAHSSGIPALRSPTK